MFERQIEIPSAEEIRERIPLPAALAAIKAERDELVKDVIAGRSDKLLVIVGPCSAHESAPVLEYVRRLGRLNERVRDKLVLVPRIYTNKPRTRGVGYKGMFSQPDPENRENILKGILTIRDLHIRAIEESGLSAADEMLYPENYAYVEDLLTYVAVGARSSENQLHRLVSSGIELPVGIKNPTGGSIPVTLNSVYAAQSPQVFMYHNWQVATHGNEYAHVVLRGRVDHYGNDIPNYHYETVMQVFEGYAASDGELKNPAIVIDSNHSNSKKTVPSADPHRGRSASEQAVRQGLQAHRQRLHDRKFPGRREPETRHRIRKIDHRSLPRLGGQRTPYSRYRGESVR